MKKKGLHIFTAAAAGLALSTAVFAGAEDPAAVYRAAVEKTNSLTSLEAHSTIDMNMASEGEMLYIPCTLDMKIADQNSQDMTMEMFLSMSVENNPVDMTMYYADGYYYMDMMGTKIKYAMDLSAMESQITSMNPQMSIDAEDFVSLDMEDTGNGKLLNFTISGASINSVVDSVMGSLGSMLGGQDFDFSSSDISGSILVSTDGYISESNMTIPVTMDIEGQSIAMDMSIGMEYVNPGQEVTVTLPPLDEYQEVDMNSLTQAAA